MGLVIKLRILPPNDLRSGGSTKLHPEVFKWLSKYGNYSVITYWFKFPYDLLPGDGVEYEPLTTLVSSGGGIEEVQTRPHWELMGFSSDVLDLSSGYLEVGFTDSGHTPLPRLRGDIKLRELLSKTYVVNEEVLNDSVTLFSVASIITFSVLIKDWSSSYVPKVIEGGEPSKDLRLRRDPLGRPWAVPEGLKKVGTSVINAWLRDRSGILDTYVRDLVEESIKYLIRGDALEVINECLSSSESRVRPTSKLLDLIIRSYLGDKGVSRECVDSVIRDYLPLTIVTSVLPKLINYFSKDLLPKVLKASVIIMSPYLNEIGDILNAYLRISPITQVL